MSGPAYLVTGGTGLVGGRLLPALAGAGATVRAVTRNPGRAVGRLPAGVEAVGWDGRHVPAESLAGCAGVIHLAGEPVFQLPFTAERRRRIRESRIASTRSIVGELRQLAPEDRPKVLVCASAVGIYGSRGDEELDESSEPGEGFLAEVCIDWEAAAREAEEVGVRVVSLRIGIVLAREGGALPLMALPFKLFVGGRLGDGRQWVPWIHVDDVVGLVRKALDDDGVSGPLNTVSPAPATNAELTRALGEVLGRPTVLPAPAFAIRAALGGLATELLGSRRVLPRNALAAGYAFAYPDLASALAEALKPAA